ncbi:MAG: DUF2062 domain-containing protein [Halofilum sp. (in: g-proteobacteria)]|nr:DUF2062 domain-containing protein [Halofilum sp. (in: g-proteobacteria)]
MERMYRWQRKLVGWRRQGRIWAERHPRTLQALERVGCLRFERPVIARGVAVGLFVALTPTVGFQTLLMLAFCALLRGNFLAAFAVSWISNPLTLAPLYFGYYLLGQRVVEPLINPLAFFSDGSLPVGALGAVSFTLGSLLVALPAAAAGYLAFTWLGRIAAARRSA